MKYKRILLKLSGEALMGSNQAGIDPKIIGEYCEEIKSIVAEGTQLGIVVGGGNIFRGLKGISEGFDRVQGDYMGMLATIINSLALQSVLEKNNIKTKILSGISIEPVCKTMNRRLAMKYLNSGYVVIMSGGTGNPYFTTDTAAALRAAEIKAEVILKGTRVDGVYSADPEKDKNAVKFENLTFTEAIDKKLGIMDLTAFTFCRENKIPIIVFNMNVKGNLKKIVNGDKIGTLVTN
ncbi:MAG: UMP kinase [Bacteroidales bacterium]|nr:UMP kinase [Bacteroidales bacterium]